MGTVFPAEASSWVARARRSVSRGALRGDSAAEDRQAAAASASKGTDVSDEILMSWRKTLLMKMNLNLPLAHHWLSQPLAGDSLETVLLEARSGRSLVQSSPQMLEWIRPAEGEAEGVDSGTPRAASGVEPAAPRVDQGASPGTGSPPVREAATAARWGCCLLRAEETNSCKDVAQLKASVPASLRVHVLYCV